VYTFAPDFGSPDYVAMPPQDNAISQTIPHRVSANREPPKIGVLTVIGDGTSLEALRASRLVPILGFAIDIGRRPVPTDGRATLALPDGTVSSLHARIQRAADESDLFVIHDLHSTNGTYVDGRRAEGPTPLNSGSVLFLGSHVLLFRLVTPTELEHLREDEAEPLAPISTLSPALATTAAKLRRLARSDAEILLVGETGVGKEVFSSAVHRLSGRTGKLVAINCAAIPRELVESELFGYEKGAHSTAQARKTGLVELAHGGTLFLDEIGDMPLELQSKLLRFLQDRKFSPLGSTRTIEADVRIVAATSRVGFDKTAHVQDALLGRLGAQPILLPPLRDRIEDIGRLAAHFLREVPDRRAFEPDAFKALHLHDWPLNVRELQKVITEAEVLSRGAPAIGFEHLPSSILTNVRVEAEDESDDTHVDPGPPQMPAGGSFEGVVRDRAPAAGTTRVRRPAPSRDELIAELTRCQGSVARVARRMNRQYAVVWRIIQRYGIDAALYRVPSSGNDDR
jgi:DNA-binding NtrC family response regulator